MFKYNKYVNINKSNKPKFESSEAKICCCCCSSPTENNTSAYGIRPY